LGELSATVAGMSRASRVAAALGGSGSSRRTGDGAIDESEAGQPGESTVLIWLHPTHSSASAPYLYAHSVWGHSEQSHFQACLWLLLCLLPQAAALWSLPAHQTLLLLLLMRPAAACGRPPPLSWVRPAGSPLWSPPVPAWLCMSHNSSHCRWVASYLHGLSVTGRREEGGRGAHEIGYQCMSGCSGVTTGVVAGG
jgi:hypothetical protein